MPELRDGFLYHPDGDDPISQLKRLVAGEHNHALDDPHRVALNDTDKAIAQAKLKHYRAQHQLSHLEAKIAELEDGIKGLEDHRVEVVDAIRRFEETGELDEILIPEPDRLLALECETIDAQDAPTRKGELASAKEAVDDALTDEWDVADARADDEYVYVTVKRRRDEPAKEHPTRDVVATTIWQAFETYAQEFKDVVRLPRLRVRLVGPVPP